MRSKTDDFNYVLDLLDVLDSAHVKCDVTDLALWPTFQTLWWRGAGYTSVCVADMAQILHIENSLRSLLSKCNRQFFFAFL